MSEVENLRITLYGVQGSGSTFPVMDEISTFMERADSRILNAVYRDLVERADDDGRLACTVDEIFGGPLGRDTIAKYRAGLEIPLPRVYGGWTTCIAVETADGARIVFDCGSGFRACARDLQSSWDDEEERDLYVFGTHTHFDHTEGFDQAAVCFDPRNSIHLYGNREYLTALDSYLGILSKYVSKERRGVQTPVTYRDMPARFRGIAIRAFEENPRTEEDSLRPWDLHDLADPVVIGETQISAFKVYHSAPCLAYHIERAGKVFVFCTDHELRRGDDPEDPRQHASEEAEQRLIARSRNADLLYRDGQFLRREYDGEIGIGNAPPVKRRDWGHSCVEDVYEMAAGCGVKRAIIGHHDPNRGWNSLNEIDDWLTRESARGNVKAELARAGMVIDL